VKLLGSDASFECDHFCRFGCSIEFAAGGGAALPAKTETPAPSPSLDGARPQLNIPGIPVERPKFVPDSTRVSTANVPPKKALLLCELDAACP